jgi:hypothetical protein
MSDNSLTGLSIKQVRIIGIMLLLSQVVFLLVILFLISKDPNGASPSDAFKLVVPAMAAVVVPFAYILFNKGITMAKAEPDQNRRLMRYRSAVIIKMAMLEGILLFCGVALLVSHDMMLLIVWAIVFALMLTSFLSAQRDSLVQEIAQGDSRLTV